jgi:DNA-binding HxlR family transcriptional regulator
MRFDSYDCSRAYPVEAALERIGRKWKGVALYHLREVTKRYNELKRDVGSVTQRMLTKQLRELESDGLIDRKVFPVVPPHVEYSLSEKGRTLKPILLVLRDWGKSCV